MSFSYLLYIILNTTLDMETRTGDEPFWRNLVKPLEILGARRIDVSPPQSSKRIICIQNIDLVLDLLVTAMVISTQVRKNVGGT